MSERTSYGYVTVDYDVEGIISPQQRQQIEKIPGYQTIYRRVGESVVVVKFETIIDFHKRVQQIKSKIDDILTHVDAK